MINSIIITQKCYKNYKLPESNIILKVEKSQDVLS